MLRTSNFFWILIGLLILLPTAGGRLIIDLAGGLMIFIILLPVILLILGLIGWQLIKSQLSTCEVCGLSSISSSAVCPGCGSDLSKKSIENDNIPASSATIDIEAKSSSNEG